MKKDKKTLPVLHIVRRALPMILRISPIIFFGYIGLLLICGLIDGIMAPVNQNLYDSITEYAINIHQGSFTKVILGTVLVVAVMMVSQIAGGIRDIISTLLRNRTKVGLDGILNQKIGSLSAEMFENKESLDDIEKASSGMFGMLDFVLSLVNILFFHLTYYVVIGIYLWNIQPVLLVSLLLIFLPVAFSQAIRARIYADEADELAPLWRMEDSYYYHTMDVRETRLFGVFHHFHELRRKVVEQIHEKQWKTSKKISQIDFLLNIVKIAGWVGVIALLFYALLQENISVGGFAAVFASVNSMFGHMEGAFRTFQDGVTNNKGTIGNFINLLEISEGDVGGKSPDFSKGIELCHVSFAYPKSEKNVLNDLTFQIEPGKTIAIVGENGSGKTTLSKLICGLYHPSSGKVFIGGCDVTKTQRSCLVENISAVFQDYQRYKAFNLSDNIIISQFNRNASVMDALAAAEVDPTDTKTFPDGINTMMSRDFDGVDVSKGQWQRVAMARGLYRQHCMIILDEPTAAIDPLEEARVYKQFDRYAKNHTITAIFITHRLGSARMADKIIVMDQGCIIETGTHEQLMQKAGKYKQLWDAQAAGYQ